MSYLFNTLASSEKGANNGLATLDATGDVPATQLDNAATVDPGTFTIAHSDLTLTANTGVYRKIGDMVWFSVSAQWSANVTEYDLTFTGMPYTAVATYGTPVMSVRPNRCKTGTGAVFTFAYISGTTLYIAWEPGDGTVASSFVKNTSNQQGYVSVTGMYLTS